MASTCKEGGTLESAHVFCNAALGRNHGSRFKNQLVLWTAPDVAGWLDKRGGPFSAWKLRFFILQSSSLFYFKNNLNIENAQPLGVIPMEGTILEVAEPAAVGVSTQCKWCITVKLGPQFGEKRDTHILSAPSKQALEEWLDKFTTAGKTHVNLLAQLHKIWRTGSELRAKLSKTPAYARMLSDVRGEEAEALRKALSKVKEEIVTIHDIVIGAKAQADQCEGVVMRALSLWSILSPGVEGAITMIRQLKKLKLAPACMGPVQQNLKVEGGLRQHFGPGGLLNRHVDDAFKFVERLQVELESTGELCGLLESKASFLQGQGLDKLSEDGRTALYLVCEKALNNNLEQQARIRVKAPRYTSDVNPLIFPEHDSQFMHTSETYDLCLKLKKSAQKVTVDMDDNIATTMNKITRVAEAKKILSSQFRSSRYEVLKVGMTAALRAAKAGVSKTNPRGSLTGPSIDPPVDAVGDNIDDPNDSDQEDLD